MSKLFATSEPHRVYYADTVEIEYLDGRFMRLYLDQLTEFNDLVERYRETFYDYRLMFFHADGVFHVTQTSKRS